MTDEEWFDARVIPRLERMVGRRVVGEILDLFFRMTPERVAVVRAGDVEAAARALHSLKSSAGMVGGSELHRLAQDLEQLAWDEQAGAVAARLDELEAAVARLTPRLEVERRRLKE